MFWLSLYSYLYVKFHLLNALNIYKFNIEYV